ncbi:sulfatase [Actinopolymorpha sp. B17G11]|uniref:sulfatase family protein n=1 Tax=Actinopolymorpha sp. B17G11 TaxID=3160861 RepID=UPI0032E4E6BC
MTGRPNVIVLMTDDHATHAMSCYGSVINQTPHLDRLAAGGVRFTNAFCTNALCAPSRASILTGTYSHVNGVRTLDDNLDNRQTTFPSLLQGAGYQTALVGKWHLGHGERHDPAGFDHWNVLPEQGVYDDPELIENGTPTRRRGYVTDLLTDLALDRLDGRDPAKPFLLMLHHKAPHSPWVPAPRHATLYEDDALPVPATFDDDHATRAEAIRIARIRIDSHLSAEELKQPVPTGLTWPEERHWKYQRFVKDYLRCVAAVDESVGRLLDWLDDAGLADDTIVVYTSDQGFFLGDHGWFDKRFMYEESLRMPLLVRYPREVPAGETRDAMVLNVDFAQTLLDYAGVPAPEGMQGRSFRAVCGRDQIDGWREAFYYRYWEHLSAINVCAHYGVRTKRHKLIYYYGEGLGTTGSSDRRMTPEWELFDLAEDPCELTNVYGDARYAQVREDLTARLCDLKAEVGDLL